MSLLQIEWCPQCQGAVKFAMMADNEGPGTLMKLIYTRHDLGLQLDPNGGPPTRNVKTQAYDNGCNTIHYALNREPAFFSDVDMYVDAFHMAGHVKCRKSFNTGASCTHSRRRCRGCVWSAAASLLMLRICSPFMTHKPDASACAFFGRWNAEERVRWE